MPKKKYIVSLTPSERNFLEQLTKKGKTAAYKMNHARILLKADINQKEEGWTDRQISESLNIGHATIERVVKLSHCVTTNDSSSELNVRFSPHSAPLCLGSFYEYQI